MDDLDTTSRSELLMRSAVTVLCRDCGDERLFLPVEDDAVGEFCCTGCDAAVFLLTEFGSPAQRREHVG